MPKLKVKLRYDMMSPLRDIHDVHGTSHVAQHMRVGQFISPFLESGRLGSRVGITRVDNKQRKAAVYKFKSNLR